MWQSWGEMHGWLIEKWALGCIENIFWCAYGEGGAQMGGMMTFNSGWQWKGDSGEPMSSPTPLPFYSPQHLSDPLP